MDTNIFSSTTPVTATLGISIEPINNVLEQVASLQTPSSTSIQSNALVPISSVGAGASNIKPDSVAAIAQKVMSHLYNHVTSFATAVLPPGSTVLVPAGGPGSAANILGSAGGSGIDSSFLPVKAFNDWYQNIVRKTKADPTAVPTPRPGELLIYDCRPSPGFNSKVQKSTSSFLDQDTAVSPLAIAHHISSPPTPTPNLGIPTFTAQTSSSDYFLDDDTPEPYSPRELEYNPQKGATENLDSPVNLTGSIGNNTPLSEDSKSCSASISHAILNSGAVQGSSSLPLPNRPIRCLQWNIERNYKSNEILDTLTELDADILCIQEIDIGCRRSGYDRDHFLEICKSQGLYGGFVPEFCELEHPKRKDRDQGGGVHGNAIFSKWPINGFRVLDHVHHAYEWERDGLKLNEPRLGRRFTIVADVQTPFGPLLCYSAHLEVFTGIIGRISALSDILADSTLYADKYPYQILFGDLNTISHSIARLAKTISTDQYRVASIGSHEAEWWDKNLWSWHVEDGEFNLALATGGWSWLRQFGFLGLGTGWGKKDDNDKEKNNSTFWSADAKYTKWLRNLVGAGVDNITQSRQNQFATDKLIAVEHQEHYSSMRTDISVHGHLDMDGQESEMSYREDESIILVDRSRSSSIITLESSLIEKSECVSSSSVWSSPNTTTSTRRNRCRRDSSDESGSDSPIPSTPSPTLRLIPPTPKDSISGIHGREEDRGITLLDGYDDSDERDDDGVGVNDIGDEIRDSLLQRQFGYNDNDNDNDNDTQFFNDQFFYDPIMTADMTLRYNITNTNPPFSTFDSSAKVDTFKDPQPPFLLSALKTDHPYFSTQRLWSGFTPLVLHQARNPGFYDPWSSGKDMTLHNPNFFGLLKAKLDFTLLMNMKCVSQHVGNHDYSASDHKWLLVEVEFEREFKLKDSVSSEKENVKEKEIRGDKIALPSKEQQYLWWRERRQELRQTTQPLKPHRQTKKHHNSSSSFSKSFIAATLTTVVAGGLWLWSRGK
ncbi:hypothetical protein BGZ76_004176 [Entomortierella beljakovae]|nr:hypothetical protein BGZ76_004176 [Entomortierella beljakovae]